MPRPMPPDDDPGSAPPPPAHGDDLHDSRGHELAMRLPEWDLVPPTEFLDRTRGRSR